MVHKRVAMVSDSGYKTLWRTPGQGFKSLHPNPKENVLVHTGNALLHRQLRHGVPLEILTERFKHYLEVMTRSDALTKDAILECDGNMRVMSFHKWSCKVLVDAQTKAFYGEKLNEIMPDIAEVFDQWDQNSWMTTYQYPAVLSKAASVPRDKIIFAIKAFLDLPKDQRADAVSFVDELDGEQRNAGLDSEDAARVFMIIYWAINTNSMKSAFWVLSNALCRPNLIAALREEIFPAIKFSPDSKPITASTPLTIDHKYLLSFCPLLNAVFDETLRLTSTSSNFREVIAPAQVDGNTIPMDAKICIPQRQLLLDPEGFGPDALEWKPERWLKKDEKSRLERSGYYRPFGGGVTLCSGRFLARREVLAFIAILLARYEIEAVREGEEVLGVKGRPWPRIADGLPSLGVSMQIMGDDLIVKVTDRKLGED